MEMMPEIGFGATCASIGGMILGRRTHTRTKRNARSVKQASGPQNQQGHSQNTQEAISHFLCTAKGIFSFCMLGVLREENEECRPKLQTALPQEAVCLLRA